MQFGKHVKSGGDLNKWVDPVERNKPDRHEMRDPAYMKTNTKDGKTPKTTTHFVFPGL